MLADCSKVKSFIPQELRNSRWPMFIGVILAGLVVLQALPSDWQAALRYDRTACLQGEYWRLLTAPWVHLGWAHLALNVVGLILMAWVFARDWPLFRWLLALAVAGLVSTLGVHLGNPDVFWLVGLSGALHGLFGFSAVGWLRMGDRAGWVLLAGLGIKLVYEQWLGSLAISEAIVGGNVVTAAHLWGAVGGLAWAAMDRLCFRRGPAPL